MRYFTWVAGLPTVVAGGTTAVGIALAKAFYEGAERERAIGLFSG